MTGGQMAPTTLIGQKTTTSPYGRSEEWSGAPIKVLRDAQQIPDCYYAERVALNTTANINKAKKAIKKAFTYQMEGHGLNHRRDPLHLPDNWGFSPVEAMKWLEENMIPYYPLVYTRIRGPNKNEGTVYIRRLRRAGHAAHRQVPGRGRYGDR